MDDARRRKPIRVLLQCLAIVGLILPAPVIFAQPIFDDDFDPDFEPASMVGMTQAHNTARMAEPAVPPLATVFWSNDLMAIAEEWVANCRFEHRSKADLSSLNSGENIAAYSSGANPAPKDVVLGFNVSGTRFDGWVDERGNYNYSTDRCERGQCGHYTQLVWAPTTLVGCAKNKCSTNSPFGAGFPEWEIWVCNYRERGNLVGVRPFCSSSQTDACASP